MLRLCKIFVAILLSVVADGSAATPVSVLFVGNSLTQANDLPSVFKQFAAQSPQHAEVEVQSITPGGALFYHHWKRGEALSILRKSRPAFLILQGQSTEPLSSPQNFTYYAGLFKAEADRVGAVTILFSTWARPAGDPYYQDPSSGGSPAEMQKQLNDAYARLAQSLNVKLAPVGVAWDNARRDAPSIELLDGTQHPSFAGTYLAAAVLFRTIFNTPAAISNYCGGLPRDTALTLQRVAASTSPTQKP
jgi:hypothetical protein